MKGSNTTKLTVAPAPPAQFGRVVAKLGKVEGEVRVRVAPKLPYKPDFSKVPESRTPGGWVNTQGKFGMVKLPDGSFALKKLAVIPSPLVARANAFIGTPDMKDYTIQADLMGTKVGDDVPDCGVVANRYTLMFFGNNKLLRLVSWDALPRIEKNIPWEFKPGTWYRLKLTVDIHGDKGVVRGKVWEADKTEPKEWTLEVEDPIANKEGAPALYANATGIAPPKPGTEVFFRNVSVIPNKAAPSGEKTEQAKPEAAGLRKTRCRLRPSPACRWLSSAVRPAAGFLPGSAAGRKGIPVLVSPAASSAGLADKRRTKIMTTSSTLRRPLALAATVLVFGGLITAIALETAKREDKPATTAARNPKDWPLFGGTLARDLVNTVDKNIPTDWDVTERQGRQHQVGSTTRLQGLRRADHRRRQDLHRHQQ